MARSDKMVAEVRRIAHIISTRPVLGHWPHMEAGKDTQILLLAANFIESLDREVQTVAEIGHKLMAAGEPSDSVSEK